MNAWKLSRAVGAKQILRSAASKSSNEITVHPVREDYFQHVLDHVTPIFLRDEPLSRCFPPCTTGQRERDFRKYAEIQLRSGFSVMALDGNKVVGSCLSRVLTRDEVFNYVIPSELGPDDDLLNYNVVRMIVTLHQRLDLFAASDDDRILELGLCSVEPTYTGRGLASRLFRASLELGAAQGVQAAKADCTGPASAGGCRRAGMVAVCKLPYDEYQVHGNIVFKSPPGSYLSVMACRLQKSDPYVLPFHIPSKS